MRPSENDYPPFFRGYISLVPEHDPLPVLEAQITELERMAAAAGADRERYRYAPGKWSVREIFGHLNDGERVFGFRAFCFSRGETAPLPSFDQDEYVARSGYDAHPLVELAREFADLRRSHLSMFRRLTPGEWDRSGTAADSRITVRALAYAMAGHVRHHVNGLRNSYGIVPGG